jgi:hypothetical protein
MRCDDVRTILEEVRGPEAPESVREHLASCAECAEMWRASRVVNAGFRVLARDSGPEPSWGFPQRVLRRIQEAAGQSKTAADFLERAGRRVVWATLGVTLAVLLALVVPPSGPVRASSEPDNLVVATASTENYSVIDVDNSDISTPAVQPAVEGVKK